MHTKLSLCLLAATLALLATPLRAQQEIPPDPWSTTCEDSVEHLARDSIDKKVSFSVANPAPSGQPRFLDELNNLSRPASRKLVNAVRKHHSPAWFVLRFKLNDAVMASAVLEKSNSSFEGLTSNLIVATGNSCSVGEDVPLKISQLSRAQLVAVYNSQRQILANEDITNEDLLKGINDVLQYNLNDQLEAYIKSR